MEINEAKILKRALEKDISSLLKSFELKTGLRPGVIFHERKDYYQKEDNIEPLYYYVNVPIHL